MPISMKYQCVFLHIAKTGGTSIEMALDIESGRETLYEPRYLSGNVFAMQHLPYESVKQIIQGSPAEHFVKFTVVRNPWDRCLSDYLWRRRFRVPLGNVSFRDYLRFTEQAMLELNDDSGANDWRSDSTLVSKAFLGHILPQYLYFPSDSSEIVHIIRFETLTDDFNRFFLQEISHRINSTLVPILRHENATRRKKPESCEKRRSRSLNRDVGNDCVHFSEYYDDEMIDIVRRAYSRDAQLFGYEFQDRRSKE